MKHQICCSIIALMTMALAQAAVPVRSSGGTMRTIATQQAGHAMTPRSLPTQKAPKALAEAPENLQTVPFVHTLGKNEASTNTALYEVVDANNDTKTWKPGGFTAYSVCMKPTAADVEANDDWLLSPPVELKAGTSYRMSFEVGRALSSGSEDIFEVLMGTERSVEGMTTDITGKVSITQKDFEVREFDFTVAEDGYYYFGLHCISPKATSGNMKLCNFGIKVATPKVTPAAAGQLSYKLGENGSLTATCTYTAPTVDIDGNQLTEPFSRIEIKTNWVVSHNLADVKPGETVTFETELYNNGYNRLEATAYINDTPGETVLINNFWAGPDNPKPVTNVNVRLSDDYRHVILSWDPVSDEGENGGWVDVSAVTYYIFDAFGSYYDPAIATTTETSVTLDYTSLEGQDFVAYQITAGVNETYYSIDASSDIVTVGLPEPVPFRESFNDGYYQNAWAVDPESDYYSFITGTYCDNELQTNIDDEGAEPTFLNSQDGDNGFFIMIPTEKDARYGFFSTKIDISGADNPVFEFYYQGKGSIIDAMLACDGQQFQTVRSIDLKDNPTDDWTLCRIELAPYKAASYIQVELRVTGAHNTDETTWSVPIDNIRVRNLVEKDLMLASLSVPAKVKAGEEFTVTAKVENNGEQPAEGAVVTLTRDGAAAGSIELPVIMPSETHTVTFTQTTGLFDNETLKFEAAIVWAGDLDDSNNTATAGTAVIMPVYPTATGVTAISSDNGVELSWEAPDYEAMAQPVNRIEDFEDESYEPLTIADFGGWTMIDADGKRTYTFLGDTGNPYRTSPMAFQLFNPATAGVPDESMIDAAPHSGQTMLVGWSAQGQNDNWLISPALSGRQQTVSFFAKSFTIAYAESFEVYYSTGGTAIADFIRIDDVNGYPADNRVPEEWTEYSFSIPEGATHFAVRHTSDDTYALYLDDFTFESGGALPFDIALTGYNVYRNGVKIVDEPVAGTTHIDTAVTPGAHDYHLTAVYNHGESAISEVCHVVHTQSGIAGVESQTATVIAADGCIIITGAESLNVTVSAVNGICLHSGVAGNTVKVNTGTGIFIVTVGDDTIKMAVR